MKRKLSVVCLIALLLGSILPVAAHSVDNTNSYTKQLARGDKKVHHPVHINSISGNNTQIL
ncbi:MAG: hypothetical protein ACTTKY_01685 [Catonella sp.]